MTAPRGTVAPPSGAQAPLVRARGLGKRYPLYSSPADRLGHALLGSWYGRRQEFVALEDVSFELAPGDALAVVGRNGAGKSTLLQILAGILRPSSGTMQVPERVAGLLELGSGFNPEFTGRENVYLNAAILGFGRRQIDERLDDILDFADIGDFVDRPVKTYSSGMYLRLAFSVAINVEPELLLVDEALTVGDVFFRQKCYQRLEGLRSQGMSVLLVTHSMVDAAEFCNRGLVLSRGRLVYDGTGKEAVEYYFHHEHDTPTGRGAAAAPGPPPQAAQVDGAIDPLWTQRAEVIALDATPQFGVAGTVATRMLLLDEVGQPRRVFEQGQTLRVFAEFDLKEPIRVPLFGVQLMNARGIMVHGKNSLQFPGAPPQCVAEPAILQYEQSIELNIDVGDYTIDLGFADVDAEAYAQRGRLLPTELFAHVRRLCHVTQAVSFTVRHASEGYPCRFPHFGAADLPGRQQMRCLPALAAPAPGRLAEPAA